MMQKSIRVKKYLFRRRAGSVSLIICLLAGAITSLLLLCFQAASMRAAEVRVVRAAGSTIDVNLGTYCKELKELYGLWGVNQDNLSDNVFYQLIQPWQNDAKLRLQVSEYTLSEKSLEDQIVSYMHLRAPAGLLAGYVEGMNNFLNSENGQLQEYAPRHENNIGSLPELPANISELQFSDVREIQKYLQDNLFCYTPATLTVKAVRECVDWVLSPVFEPLEDALVKSIRHRLSEAIQNVLPVNPVDFGADQQAFTPKLLQPEQISEVAELVQKVLIPSDNRIWQRFLISEYALNTFVSDVPFKIINDRKIMRCTPGGIRHDQLDSNRVNELEKIVTGETDLENARNRVKTNITLTRLIIRLTQVISDNEKLQSYRPAANLLSALITAASAGTVMIDPEWLVWLVAVSDAVRMADHDYKQLLKGNSVTLWEKNGESYLEMYYHDYIRLFLLAQPEKKLLERVGGQISQVLPGNYACSIKASVQWQSFSYSTTSGY